MRIGLGSAPICGLEAGPWEKQRLASVNCCIRDLEVGLPTHAAAITAVVAALGNLILERDNVALPVTLNHVDEQAIVMRQVEVERATSPLRGKACAAQCGRVKVPREGGSTMVRRDG